MKGGDVGNEVFLVAPKYYYKNSKGNEDSGLNFSNHKSNRNLFDHSDSLIIKTEKPTKKMSKMNLM